MALTKVSYSMISGEVANIMDFGAVSGVECHAAFQTAVESGASTVLIPKGTWWIDTTITVPSNVSVVGQGQGSIVRPITNNIFAFTTATSADNIQFSNFVIAPASYTINNKGGIRAVGVVGGSIAQAVTNLKIENVTFQNCGDNAVKLDNVRDSSVINNTFYSCQKDIVLEAQNLNVLISGNVGEGIGNIGDTTNGVFIDVYAVLAGTSTRVTNYAANNAHTTPGTIDKPEGIVITNNFCVGYAYGLRLDCVYVASVADNIIDTIYVSGVQYNGSFKVVFGNNFVGLHSTSVPAVTSYGVIVNNTVEYKLHNNTINYLEYGVYTLASSGGVVFSNTIEYVAITVVDVAGLYLDATSSQLNCDSNRVVSSATGTVYAALNEKNVSLTKNTIAGAGTLHLSGTDINQSNNSWNSLNSGNPGSTTLPGGIRMMWGITPTEIALIAGGTVSWVIDFTTIGLTDFPQTPYIAQATIGINGDGIVSVIALSTTGLTVYLKNTSAISQNFNAYWSVLGRDSI